MGHLYKVCTVLDALLPLPEQAWYQWARWHVRKHDVTLPLWGWKAKLQSKLQARGIDL